MKVRRILLPGLFAALLTLGCGYPDDELDYGELTLHSEQEPYYPPEYEDYSEPPEEGPVPERPPTDPTVEACKAGCYEAQQICLAYCNAFGGCSASTCFGDIHLSCLALCEGTGG